MCRWARREVVEMYQSSMPFSVTERSLVPARRSWSRSAMVSSRETVIRLVFQTTMASNGASADVARAMSSSNLSVLPGGSA